jgi:hypothetical protein
MRSILGTIRYWLPVLAGIAALIVALFVGTIVAWILLIVSFALLLDGFTAMWERAGGTGNITTYRQ